MLDWIAQVRPLASFECEWLSSQEIVDRTGELADVFDQTDSGYFFWPAAFTHRTRVVLDGSQRAAGLATRFNRDFVVDPSGLEIERHPGMGRERTLGSTGSLRKLVRSQSVFAPHLIGLWLSERDGAFEAESTPAGGALVRVKDLGVLVHVDRHRFAGREPEPLVVRRLEFVNSDGSAEVWWEYDDFNQVSGSTVFTGYSRTMFSVRRDGSLYESPPATLVEMKPLSTLSRSASVDAASSTDASATPIGGVSGEQPSGRAGGGGHGWMLALAGGSLLFVGGIVWAARRRFD